MSKRYRPALWRRASTGDLSTPESGQTSPPRLVERPEQQTAISAPGLQGCVDVVEAEWVAGWVWNACNPTERLLVGIEANDEIIATVLADDYRPDLERTGKGDGCYAFNLSLPPGVQRGGAAVRCIVPDRSYEIPKGTRRG